MIRVLRSFLMPLSMVWWLVAVLKRALYQGGVLTRYESPLPSIVVGNLSMGGTGKTPISGHLIQMLVKEGYKVAYLSRGYGRKTKGLYQVLSSAAPDQVGDEALMIKIQHPDVDVWVCENRVIGMQHIEQDTQAEVVVLDDAFQHLRFKAGFYMLLSTAQNPFFKDWLFPAGTLREPRRAVRYADAVIFTKYVAGTERFDKTASAIQNIAAPTFYTGVAYSYELQEVYGQSTLPVDSSTPVLAFSAIAINEDFFQAVKARFHLVGQQGFRDHHTFSLEDLQVVKAHFEQLKEQFPNLIILTTEKDAARLQTLDGAREFDLIPLFYWSITPKFLANSQEQFDRLILDYVESNKRSS